MDFIHFDNDTHHIGRPVDHLFRYFIQIKFKGFIQIGSIKLK